MLMKLSILCEIWLNIMQLVECCQAETKQPRSAGLLGERVAPREILLS